MTFLTRFFICNLFLILLLGIFLFWKRMLKRHLTQSVQYHLWYFYILAMLLPFIPRKNTSPGNLLLKLRRYLFPGNQASLFSESGISRLPSNDLRIQDFSTTMAASDTGINTWLIWLWLTGMAIMATLFLRTAMKVYRMRRDSSQITEQREPELYRLYTHCCQELRILRKVTLYSSCQIQSPVSYGWIRPKIIIPQDLDISLSQEELRFIFLHELQHCRHRDGLLNGIACILQIPYWFNPLIWYAFTRLRRDRETACDHAVLGVVGYSQGIEYGYAIIHCIEEMQERTFLSPVSHIGESKSSIRQRIVQIATYAEDSKAKKAKSAAILLLAAVLVYGCSPLLTAFAAANTQFQLQSDHWEPFDASPYFGPSEGTFVLYDMARDQYQIYDKERCEKRTAPNSTYKIYSGLIALEEGVISPDSNCQTWNGTSQPFESWNQDQTLYTAMKNSVNWYFQNLDRQIGLSTLSRYYSKISYGNCDLTGGVDSYWAESSLKISPIEQVLLLSDLLQNSWDFQEKNIQCVKEALFLGDTSIGKLYGKTGTGSSNGKSRNGWFVGFLEKDGQTYCFATNLQGSDNCTGKTASEITLKILRTALS